MIKKSLRAYITSCQLVFFVLLHRKVVRVFLRQRIEHHVHRVLKILIILSGFHGIDHVDQRGKILLLRRRNVMQIANQRRVQKRFAFDPEIFTAYFLRLWC